MVEEKSSRQIDMPLLHSPYRPPLHLFNGHLQTIVPSLFRKVEGVQYKRETIPTSDDDCLDIDWLKNDSKKLIIISHGLEGNTSRHYVKGMAKYFRLRKWDVLAWNCRGCGGSINKTPRLYHHAATEDLHQVVMHALSQDQYETIVLIGFSMGGSMTLKYLGEEKYPASKEIKASVVFSVPCDLKSSSRALDKFSNAFYRNRFLKKLKKKLVLKAEQFPDSFDVSNFDTIKSFTVFDNRYTAPLHGFKDADDFYTQASATRYLPALGIPTLIVNAKNDPILAPECFPYALAERLSKIYFETPRHGGHGGFPLQGKEENWMDVRAFEFLREVVGH